MLLSVQLVVICCLWGISLIVERRRPRVNPLLLIAGIYILLQAWWMTVNAKFTCDLETMQFTPLSPPIPGATGSIARGQSFEIALLMTGLVSVAFFIADLAGSSTWRRRFLIAMAATGAAVVCIGALQRVTHAREIYWASEVIGGGFFGPYRNHDNAAALINLAWPLAGGLFVAALGSAKLWLRFVYGACAVLGVAGAVATGSRAGSLLGFLVLVIFALWLLRQSIAGRLGAVKLPELITASILMLVLMAALAAFTGIDFSIRRWSELEGELTSKNYRWLAYQVCLKIIPQAGWFGYGPGTFQCAFPHFTHEFGDALKGRWTYAHQDYLQAVIEWGRVGAIAWAVYLAGAIVRACRAFARHHRALTLSRRTQFTSILLALGAVLLHSLVDFPMQIASIHLYMAVLLGLLWGAGQWITEPSRSTHGVHGEERAQPIRI